MKNRILLIIFCLVFLHNAVWVKAESKDVKAKYEYQESDTVFDALLDGDVNVTVDSIEINISNSNSDNGEQIVIIPVKDESIIEDYIYGSNSYDAYFIDFYNSNGKTDLSSPIRLSSVIGKNYEDATISVISTSGRLLYEGSIFNNSFSFQVTESSYIIIDYDSTRRGDVNKDNLININDLVQLRRHLAGIKPIPEDNLRFADINKDNRVNINDLVKLRKYLAGLEEL